jgi:hypothetical protein
VRHPPLSPFLTTRNGGLNIRSNLVSPRAPDNSEFDCDYAANADSHLG